MKRDELISLCILSEARFEAVQQQIHGATYLCAWGIGDCLVAFDPPVRLEQLNEVLSGINHENRTSRA
jgi:hypothetical protein